MTYDSPQPAPRSQEMPAPRFDVDMASRQDGRMNQTGNLDQRGRLDQTQTGRVQQDVTGRVQQNVDGNRLSTGDVRSSNTVDSRNAVDTSSQSDSRSQSGSQSRVDNSNQAGGATIDDHSVNNRTDRSVNLGPQFLPECTYGLSIGVPGSGAFQIGVPSQECMAARGKAMEAQADAAKEAARAQADAQVGTARAHADAQVGTARAQAEASLLTTGMQLESQDRAGALNHNQVMTKIACDFSIDRAGTARQSWQQFDQMGSRIGKHPTAKAGTQQIWTEAVTASAQSMDAGAICVESTRSQLGIEQKKFDVPALEIEVPPAPKPRPPVHRPKPPALKPTEPCLDEDRTKK